MIPGDMVRAITGKVGMLHAVELDGDLVIRFDNIELCFHGEPTVIVPHLYVRYHSDDVEALSGEQKGS